MTRTTEQQNGADNLEEEGVVDNKHISCSTVTHIISKVGHLMLSLFLVYFLEYTIRISLNWACAEQIINLEPGRKDEFIYDNAFIIFSLCYHVGVFISRSSLSFYKISNVWVVTAV